MNKKKQRDYWLVLKKYLDDYMDRGKGDGRYFVMVCPTDDELLVNINMVSVCRLGYADDYKSIILYDGLGNRVVTYQIDQISTTMLAILAGRMLTYVHSYVSMFCQRPIDDIVHDSEHVVTPSEVPKEEIKKLPHPEYAEIETQTSRPPDNSVKSDVPKPDTSTCQQDDYAELMAQYIDIIAGKIKNDVLRLWTKKTGDVCTSRSDFNLFWGTYKKRAMAELVPKLVRTWSPYMKYPLAAYIVG